MRVLGKWRQPNFDVVDWLATGFIPRAFVIVVLSGMLLVGGLNHGYKKGRDHGFAVGIDHVVPYGSWVIDVKSGIITKQQALDSMEAFSNSQLDKLFNEVPWYAK